MTLLWWLKIWNMLDLEQWVLGMQISINIKQISFFPHFNMQIQCVIPARPWCWIILDHFYYIKLGVCSCLFAVHHILHFKSKRYFFPYGWSDPKEPVMLICHSRQISEGGRLAKQRKQKSSGKRRPQQRVCRSQKNFLLPEPPDGVGSEEPLFLCPCFHWKT